MKKILGFWAGTQAHKDAIREKEVEELLRRRRKLRTAFGQGNGTLADMLAPEALAPSKSSRFWRGLPAYGTLADMR